MKFTLGGVALVLGLVLIALWFFHGGEEGRGENVPASVMAPGEQAVARAYELEPAEAVGIEPPMAPRTSAADPTEAPEATAAPDRARPLTQSRLSDAATLPPGRDAAPYRPVGG